MVAKVQARISTVPNHDQEGRRIRAGEVLSMRRTSKHVIGQVLSTQASWQSDRPVHDGDSDGSERLPVWKSKGLSNAPCTNQRDFETENLNLAKAIKNVPDDGGNSSRPATLSEQENRCG